MMSPSSRGAGTPRGVKLSGLLKDELPLWLSISVLLFSPLVEGGTTQLPVFILEALTVALMLARLPELRRDGFFHFGIDRLDAAAFAFIAAAIVGAAIAPYKYMALVWMRVITCYALFYILARDIFRRAGNTSFAVRMLFGLAAVESGIVIYQWAAGLERVKGTFFNPNMLAGWLVPVMMLALSLAWPGGASRRSGGYRAGLAALALAITAAVLLTGSRGGVLCLCAGLLVLLWAHSKRVAVVSVALLIVVVLAFPNPVREHIFSADIFNWSRASIWRYSAARMGDHPLGVGLGNYKYTSTVYNFPVDGAIIRYEKLANTAHSEYLQAGSELGFFGLAAFLAVVFMLVRLAADARRNAAPADRPLAVGLSAGLAAMLVHAVVDANLHEPGIVFLLIGFVCMLRPLANRKPLTEALLPLDGKRMRTVSMASAVLAGLLFVEALIPAAAYYIGLRGEGYMKRGALADARRMFDITVSLEPGNAGSHSRSAFLFYREYTVTGDKPALEKALSELGEAKRLNPIEKAYPQVLAGIRLNLALAADEQGRQALLRQALAEANSARSLDPHGYQTIMTQARLLSAMGDRAAAIKALEQLREYEPDFLQGRLILAKLYKESGFLGLSRQESCNILKRVQSLKTAEMDAVQKAFTRVDIGSVQALAEGERS